MIGSNPGRPSETSIRQNRGFTLVEIAVAVAILGVALVTLVGLHTRMLSTYFNERNRLQASLYAQYLMTMIEVQPNAPEPTSAKDDLYSALNEYDFFDSETPDQLNNQLKSWEYEMRVESIGLPLAASELADDALRRIDLVITWGPSDDEQYNLVHYVNPSPEVVSNSTTSTPTSGGQTGSGTQNTGNQGSSTPANSTASNPFSTN